MGRIRKVARELVYITLAAVIGLVYGLCAGAVIL